MKVFYIIILLVFCSCGKNHIYNLYVSNSERAQLEVEFIDNSKVLVREKIYSDEVPYKYMSSIRKYEYKWQNSVKEYYINYQNIKLKVKYIIITSDGDYVYHEKNEFKGIYEKNDKFKLASPGFVYNMNLISLKINDTLVIFDKGKKILIKDTYLNKD